MPKSQLATLVRIPFTRPVLAGSPVSVGISIPVPGVGVVPVLLAEQLAEAPQLPVQLQVQGPDPVTEEVVPVEQRLLVGVVANDCPFALPQAQAFRSTAFVAEQLTVPQESPIQVHSHLIASSVSIEDAVPVEQRLVVGAFTDDWLLALPQTQSAASTSPLQKTPNPKTPITTKNIFVLFCIFFKIKKVAAP